MLKGEGRVAMVSGAARGIDHATVERLLDMGWRVSAGVRDAPRAGRVRAADAASL